MEAQLVGFLAPFLPRLLAGAAKQVEAIGGEVVDATWTYAQKLWDRLRPAVDARPEAQDAAAKVAAAPDDERARTVLEVRLGDLLAADETLKADLSALLAEAARAGAGNSVTVGGDVTAQAKGHGIAIGVVGGDAKLKR